MNIEKELAKRLMDEGESGNRQVAYNHEISFYELVASGNMHRLEEALKTIGSTQTLGILSPDKLPPSSAVSASRPALRSP